MDDPSDKNYANFTWWIDEPVIRGSANPTDRDLQVLHAEGFTIAVSLLVESIQPPRYDKQSPSPAAGPSIPFRSKKVLHPHLNRSASSLIC
jgi:hypothetical protein